MEDNKTNKHELDKGYDLSDTVVVKNGCQGRLVYVSNRTGETFIWEQFGDEQDMEIRELRNARNQDKRFFENNWFMFDDEWVIDYLGVRNYYKKAIPIDGFDDIFTKSPSELKKILLDLSDGQKKSVEYRARILISEQKIDSLKVISTLEEVLGVQLIER